MRLNDIISIFSGVRRNLVWGGCQKKKNFILHYFDELVIQNPVMSEDQKKYHGWEWE